MQEHTITFPSFYKNRFNNSIFICFKEAREDKCLFCGIASHERDKFGYFRSERREEFYYGNGTSDILLGRFSIRLFITDAHAMANLMENGTVQE